MAHSKTVTFAKPDVDDLLVRTARMCAICNRRHGVQVHHIKPRHQGGGDEPSNAIPLCPNCHDEVHARPNPGRTTRAYSEEELRGHLERTIKLAARQSRLTIGNKDWKRDVRLLDFYASCMDRPAFRTHFHNELSFADLDQALEDTVLAINTGMQRTRDGQMIERQAGKRDLTNGDWRDKIDAVVGKLNECREALRRALGLDQMFLLHGREERWLDRHDPAFRHDSALAHEMDGLRQQAVDLMNQVLSEADLPLLKRVGDWS